MQINRNFADNIFKLNFLYKKGCILMQVSLIFVLMGPINHNPALV